MTPDDLDDLHHLAPDDLATLATAGWRIGAARCVACGGYHRVWGTLRAAGVVGGTEPDRLVLEPLLADLLRPGARARLSRPRTGARSATGRKGNME